MWALVGFLEEGCVEGLGGMEDVDLPEVCYLGIEALGCFV